MCVHFCISRNFFSYSKYISTLSYIFFWTIFFFSQASLHFFFFKFIAWDRNLLSPYVWPVVCMYVCMYVCILLVYKNAILFPYWVMMLLSNRPRSYECAYNCFWALFGFVLFLFTWTNTTLSWLICLIINIDIWGAIHPFHLI